MAEHLTADEIDGLARHETTAAALERADAHLATCADCRDQLAHAVSSGSDLLAAVRIRGRAHLTFEQLESGLKNEGALEPLARQHLASCTTCRRELDDLREFETLKPRVSAAVSTERAGPRRWRIPLWSFAGAAAMLMLAVVVSRFVLSTGGPIQLTVKLVEQPAVSRPPSTLGPKGEAELSNEVLLAIARARGTAERTRQPQTIDVQIERRQYRELLRHLQDEGVMDSAMAGQLPEGDPSSIVRVRLTLVPPG